MTRFIAFAGKSDIKSALLARLAEHAANGTIDVLGPRWGGVGGTPVGCIAADGGLKAFEAVTGFPAGLGQLLDYLCTRMGDTGRGVDLAMDWLRGTAPGTDLSAVPNRLLVFMIEEALARAQTVAAHEVSAALRGILALHRRPVDAPPSRAAWSEVQAAAVAATDAATDRLGRNCGMLAESAAWNPLTSRSTLTEVALRWCNLRAQVASTANGWTEGDAAAFDACTERFRDEVLRHDPTLATTDFPPFFEAREPELFARYVAQLRCSDVAFVDALNDLARETLARLATQPEPVG